MMFNSLLVKKKIRATLRPTPITLRLTLFNSCHRFKIKEGEQADIVI